MGKILILGDSFASDWSAKYSEYQGWPTLLARKYNVVNVAQPGISEYKIYKQLTAVNLDEFDTVIVSHTSPYRIPTRSHPIHSNDILHKHADLIYADIEFHSKKFMSVFNSSLRAAMNFFKYHYDEEFFSTTYKLMRREINDKLAGKRVIVILCLPDTINFVTEQTVLNFCELRSTEFGLINHFSKTGNEIIYDKIEEVLANV